MTTVVGMRVVIGPVGTDSARAWIAHARLTLDELEVLAPVQCDAIPESRPIFSSYVDEWARVADHGVDPFMWEAELEPEQVMFHMHAWHKVAEALVRRAEVTGEHVLPAEAQDFYRAVLRGMLDALAAEGPEYASFTQHLAAFWPGQESIVV